MCTKAVNNYPSAIIFVHECYKTQEMCVIAANTCSFVFNSFPDRYKTEEICHKAIDNYAHALEFVPDSYKTQENV